MTVPMGVRRGVVGAGSSLIALAAGLGLGLLLIVIEGVPVGTALTSIVDGAVGGSTETAATVARAIPLVGAALAWMVASRGGLFNVGIDGQMIVGGITAMMAALLLDLPPGLHLVVALGAGLLGGAAWAGVATALWATRGVNEIIATLMLNLIAVQLLSWIIRGPLHASGQQFAQTDPVPTSAAWPSIVPQAGLNWSLVLTAALMIGVAVLLKASDFGFRLRASAANEKAARSAGIATVRVRSLGMLLSGGIAGLVGADLVLGGESQVMSDGFTGTIGFDGIAVALVARTSIVAAALVALVFAALRQGGSQLEATAGVSAAPVEVMLGAVILFVAGSAVLSRRLEVRRVDASQPADPQGPSARLGSPTSQGAGS